jgi:two-component sensor histidine kinase/PAS domain-containing protein
MSFVYSDYTIAFALVAAICMMMSLYTWRRRWIPGGLYFALLMVAAAEWAMAGALENAVPDVASKILFSKLSYLGIAAITPLFLLFCLGYSQNNRLLQSRWKPLIWAVPALVIVLVFTNEWHGLIWPSVTPVSDAPGAILRYAHGPGALAEVAYSYTLMLAGSIFLLDFIVHSFKRFWLPATTVMLGVAAPWIANLLYGIGLNPAPGLDITPFAFAITGLLFSWAIFGQRLFDLVPVARETLIQVMPDGVVVLDSEGKVVEINPAAQRILGLPEKVTARDIGAAADRWPALAGSFGSTTDAEEEIMIAGPAGATWLEARVSILHDAGGRLAGRLVMLRDIDKRKRAEEDLKRSNEALKGEVAEKTLAQEALSASLHEKDVLLKEIHHRVKNNLQIVSSLLSLQTSAQGRTDPAAALRDSQNRIRSMALIHEKLYQSGDLAHIDFAEYARSLVASLARSYTSGTAVKVDAEVEGIMLDIDRAIPCGLIINELVTNSLKYAFPDGRSGTITISMSRGGGKYALTVADDGAGLPPGLDFRDTPSLGLQLVNTLASQLEGTIELDTARGTRFKITFAEIE